MEENRMIENSSQEEQRVSSRKPPNKKRRKRRRRKTRVSFLLTIGYTLFILLASAGLSYMAILMANDVFAFLKDESDVQIVVLEDTTISEMSKLLEDSGVVEYGTLFNLFVSFSASDTEFEPGTHTLSSNMDYRGILNELEKSTAVITYETVSVTIPEGYTLEQIAQLMEDNEVTTYEKFMETAETYEFSHDFLTVNEDVIYQLEGYLFPDTYEFYIGEDSVQVINKMLNNFATKIEGDITEKAEELGLTIHEVVTIASLIEREASKAEEQATISGVIHNRLNSSAYPYLNIDATIQYVVGHKEALTAEDLKIDSPYNTYTYKGLVPGAIASPGYDTLLAAVTPEEHGYYFYVAKPDGYHIFTTNLDAHNAAVAEARSMFEW